MALPTTVFPDSTTTVAVNLAGIPGISVPVSADAEGLPIGAQLLAAPFAEELILRAARCIEQSA